MSKPDPSRIERIPMSRFIAEYWWPDAGEHTALIGPNGSGKTTIGMQLLAKACERHPQTTGIALAMKPHKGPKSHGKKATGDKTVADLTRKLGGRITRTWPHPQLWPWQKRPLFWTYWPKHTMNPKVDNAIHQQAFETVILDSYARGDRWLFADEIFGLTAELKLGDELITSWTRGRSMDMGVFGATQRPAHVPLWFYSESRHFFLWRMTDGGAYERLREIGSFDPHLIRAALDTLGRHDCLYLYAPERWMAILTAD